MPSPVLFTQSTLPRNGQRTRGLRHINRSERTIHAGGILVDGAIPLERIHRLLHGAWREAIEPHHCLQHQSLPFNPRIGPSHKLKDGISQRGRRARLWRRRLRVQGESLRRAGQRAIQWPNARRRDTWNVGE